MGNNLGLDVEWDENTANQSALSNPFYSSPYAQFTFVATASTNLARIDFHGIDTNGSILLDNVALSNTPEPVSLLLAGWIVYSRLETHAFYTTIPK